MSIGFYKFYSKMYCGNFQTAWEGLTDCTFKKVCAAAHTRAGARLRQQTKQARPNPAEPVSHPLSLFFFSVKRTAFIRRKDTRLRKHSSVLIQIVSFSVHCYKARLHPSRFRIQIEPVASVPEPACFLLSLVVVKSEAKRS